MSIREKILATATSFTPVAVDVPGVGEVFVRPLTIGGMAKYLAQADGGTESAAVRMLLECVCDSSGTRQFTDADAAVVAQIPQNVAGALILVINRISGVETTETEDPAKN